MVLNRLDPSRINLRREDETWNNMPWQNVPNEPWVVHPITSLIPDRVYTVII
jgi:hypothetical protein